MCPSRNTETRSLVRGKLIPGAEVKHASVITQVKSNASAKHSLISWVEEDEKFFMYLMSVLRLLQQRHYRPYPPPSPVLGL